MGRPTQPVRARGRKSLREMMLRRRDGRDVNSGGCERVDVSPRVASTTEDHHLCDGERIRVRDGQQRRRRANPLEPARGAAVKPQLRRTTLAYHFDVAPEHLLRVSGPQRFHRRLLGGEPAGQMDRGLAPALTVGNFAVAEAALEKAIAVP